MTATTSTPFSSEGAIPFTNAAYAYVAKKIAMSADETYPTALGYNVDVSGELATITAAKATFVQNDSTYKDIQAEVLSHTSVSAVVVGLKRHGSTAGLAIGTVLTNSSYILVECWGTPAAT